MGQGQPQRLPHDLGRRGRAEELASASRRGASAAGKRGCLLERYFPVSEPRPNRLYPPRILSFFGGQHDPARDQDRGLVLRSRQGEHHGWKALVASGHPQNSGARGQRSDQSSKDDGRVISVGKAVHHACRPLRSPVTRIGDEGSEREAAQLVELSRRGIHEQPHFPMARVVAQRHGPAIGLTQAALRAQDQELFSVQACRIPPHAHVLAKAKDISAGMLEEKLLREG